MVQQKVDAVAGEVVAAMLQLSRPHETRLQEDRSAPLAETYITTAVAEAIAFDKRPRLLQPENVSGAPRLRACMLRDRELTGVPACYRCTATPGS